MSIDPTVRLVGSSIIADTVTIGPYCLIGYADLQINDEANPERTIIKDRTQIESHVVVGHGTTIGSDCWIDHHCYVGCKTTIGNKVEIMYGARIYHRTKIGDGAWISGFVCNDSVIRSEAIVMGNLVHQFREAIQGTPEPSPVVNRRAFVGFGAVVVGNITIGHGAYIAAGSVVLDDVPPGRLFAGVPAVDKGRAPIPYVSWRQR